MEQQRVRRLSLALNLQRQVVGVRFLYTWAEFQDSPLPQFRHRTRFCYMVMRASQGECLKSDLSNFGCGCAREALGLEPEDPTTTSGEMYYGCGLYASRAIAKQVQDEVVRIPQHIHGIEVGPLDQLEQADLVILVANAFQVMRIVQGYVHFFGVPKHLGMAGNQGVCSDLAARPFVKNDLNLSVLCAGTRRACKWGEGELGVGMPINLFAPVADGVLRTLNNIETPEAKDRILSNLTDPMELGFALDKSAYYGVTAKAWSDKRQEDARRYAAFLAEHQAGEGSTSEE